MDAPNARIDRQPAAGEHAPTAPDRDWSGSDGRRRSEASLLLCWVDDRGSTVRLISTTPTELSLSPD